MFRSLLFITIISSIFINMFALEPSCTSCKHFIPNNRGDVDLGLCRMFRNTCYHRGKEYNLPNYAIHCRDNENLCGKSGFLYESITSADNSILDINMDTNLDKETNLLEQKKLEQKKLEQQIQNELIELNNRCCGEVNETDEIEQLEKEFFDVFQKIKKHNKKRIYKTTKDLFSLFKRNDTN